MTPLPPLHLHLCTPPPESKPGVLNGDRKVAALLIALQPLEREEAGTEGRRTARRELERGRGGAGRGRAGRGVAKWEDRDKERERRAKAKNGT